MTARQLSPLSFATEEQRLAAARTLDHVTGFGTTNNGPWGRESSRPSSSTTSQPVNQILQDSLVQQFMSMPSTAFSDSSSIYGNTPQHRLSGGLLRGGAFSGNNSTAYAGASDFEKTAMRQSSFWNNSQPVRGGYTQTPPGGQGG